MKLVKISSSSIQIKSNEKEFELVKINDLMKISDGTVELITTVTSITDTESNYSIGEEDFIGEFTNLKNIECDIIGSLKNGLYVKSIDQYPTTSVTISLVTDEEFKTMLSAYQSNGFRIGEYASYEADAYVNGNKLFQRHAAILGNTGAGKSETVAKVIEEISKLKSANVIIFDIHGEYSELSCARNIKIGSEVAFPIWLFGLNDIATNILKVKEETSTSQMAALKKSYRSICGNPNEHKPIEFDFGIMRNELKYLDNEQVGDGEYASGAKKGMPKYKNGPMYGKLTSLVNLFDALILDERNNFLFADKPQSYLFELIDLIMSNDKPVKNIDLSEVPNDIAIQIIGCITKLVWNIKLMQKEITPMTMLCDEAHVYIPNNFQLLPSERRMVEVFENIAKEGRKFGLTLLPATQRPSELNKTILAQCGNFIVMKLNNENDKSIIKGMLPDGSESVIDSTTMFNPGECVLIGDASPIPLKVKVSLAKERPNSRSIEFWDEWNSEHKEIDTHSLVSKFLEV